VRKKKPNHDQNSRNSQHPRC